MDNLRIEVAKAGLSMDMPHKTRKLKIENPSKILQRIDMSQRQKMFCLDIGVAHASIKGVEHKAWPKFGRKIALTWHQNIELILTHPFD